MIYNDIKIIHDDMSDKERHHKINKNLLGLLLSTSLIIGIGLVMLYSTSSNLAGSSFFVKQCIWVTLGCVGILAVNFLGYKTLAKYSLIIILGCCVFLILARLSAPIKGAHRWIKTPLGNIQPSEYAKIALCLFVGNYCARHLRYLNYWFSKKGFSRFFIGWHKHGILPISAVSGILIVLVLAGKDFGTTALLIAVFLITLFVAGLKSRYILLGVPLATLGALYVYFFDPERLSRATSFLTPELFQKGDGYQLWSSILALGSGGFTGLGFTDGRMKLRYLPEAHTDFILAITGEELGFIFIAIIIMLYIAFLWCGLNISLNAKDKRGVFIGVAICATISIQACINIAVVSGSMPTKGMPAPFISYGGSNMITCLLGVGLLVNIALNELYPDFNKNKIAKLKKLILRRS